MLSRRMQVLGAIAVSAVIFFVMAMAIRDTAPWAKEGPEAASSDAQLDGIADGLFAKHVVALEVLGVLLTAAMIGALVIARPLSAVDDDEHYPTVSAEQSASAEAASDVAAHSLPAEVAK